MNTTSSSAPRISSPTTAIRRADDSNKRALVLAGGGAAGNAWEIGLIAGLSDAGVDVTQADLIIGTSAGSTVAAQITSATPDGELYARIVEEVAQPRVGVAGSDRGRAPDLSGQSYLDWTNAMIGAAQDASDMRRRMGAAALEMDPSDSSSQRWRRVVSARYLATQVDELRNGGSRVETVFPDAGAGDVFDANALDPSTRPQAARGGYNQGRALADRLAEVWR